MSTILSNSGYSPGLIQHQLAERGGQDAFNVITGNWEDAQASGLLDAATTTRVALQTAVSAALMVISTETLVSRGAVDPNFSLEA
jgi:chaperonin GroEL